MKKQSVNYLNLLQKPISTDFPRDSVWVDGPTKRPLTKKLIVCAMVGQSALVVIALAANPESAENQLIFQFENLNSRTMPPVLLNAIRFEEMSELGAIAIAQCGQVLLRIRGRKIICRLTLANRTFRNSVTVTAAQAKWLVQNWVE